MAFFLKPCFKLRKKKKGPGKNPTTYFETYYDVECPIPNEKIQINSSIDRERNRVGRSSKLKLSESESDIESSESEEIMKTNEGGQRKNCSQNILDVLSSAVEYLSDEISTSEDNGYIMMSSSSNLDEINSKGNESKNLLNKSTDAFEEKVDISNEHMHSEKEQDQHNEKLIVLCKSSSEFKIADCLSNDISLIDILKSESEPNVKVFELSSINESVAQLIDFISNRQHICEVHCKVPVEFFDHITKRKLFSNEINRDSRNDMQCKDEISPHENECQSKNSDNTLLPEELGQGPVNSIDEYWSETIILNQIPNEPVKSLNSNDLISTRTTLFEQTNHEPTATFVSKDENSSKTKFSEEINEELLTHITSKAENSINFKRLDVEPETLCYSKTVNSINTTFFEQIQHDPTKTFASKDGNSNKTLFSEENIKESSTPRYSKAENTSKTTRFKQMDLDPVSSFNSKVGSSINTTLFRKTNPQPLTPLNSDDENAKDDDKSSKYKVMTFQFFDTELSEAVKKCLGTHENLDNSDENIVKIISIDDIKRSLQAYKKEKLDASHQQESDAENTIENINNCVDDNCLETHKNLDNNDENIVELISVDHTKKRFQAHKKEKFNASKKNQDNQKESEMTENINTCIGGSTPQTGRIKNTFQSYEIDKDYTYKYIRKTTEDSGENIYNFVGDNIHETVDTKNTFQSYEIDKYDSYNYIRNTTENCENIYNFLGDNIPETEDIKNTFQSYKTEKRDTYSKEKPRKTEHSKENIKFIGDNIAEIEQKNEDISNSDEILPVFLTDNATQSSFLFKCEQNLSDVLECSGDHKANFNEMSEDKNITCRLAAKQIPGLENNDTNNMSNKSNCKKKSKRRRSRNVLLNSLNIKSSPENTKNEISSASVQQQNEVLKQNCTQNSIEIDNNLPTMQIPGIKPNQMMVGHALMYGDQPSNVISTEKTDLMTDFERDSSGFVTNDNKTKFNNTAISETIMENFRSDENNFFLESNISKKVNQECGNVDVNETEKELIPHHNKFAIKFTEEMGLQIQKTIKKIISYVKNEIAQCYNLNKKDPKNFKRLLKELLFDYNFYHNPNEELLKNIKYVDPYPSADSALIPVETNQEIMTISENIDDSYYLKNYGDHNNTDPIYTDNKYLDNKNKNKPNHEEYFIQINSSNTSCEGYELHLKCSFGNAEASNLEETLMNPVIENTNNEDEYCPPVDDIGEQQTLDQYLALAESIRYEKKVKKSKDTTLSTNENIQHEDLSDISIPTNNYSANENITCYQMLYEDNNKPSPLSNRKRVRFKGLETYSDEEDIWKLPYAPSEGGDTGDQEASLINSPKTQITSYQDWNAMETHDYGTGNATILTYPNTTDQCTCKMQDIQSDFTIILSPKETTGSVNCNVNMTISRDTSNTSPCVTSPISIKVTRTDISNKEHSSAKALEAKQKLSSEDILEMCRHHRERSFELKSIERERLKNLELFNLQKTEALKPMKPAIRTIPLHPTESFEFTLSGTNQPGHSQKPINKFHKSSNHEYHPLLTAEHIENQTMTSSNCDIPNDYFSDISLDTVPEKPPQINEDIYRKKYEEMFVLPSPVFRTPVRKKILSASKAIRSPKRSLKIEQPSLKDACKYSPQKSSENRPNSYYFNLPPRKIEHPNFAENKSKKQLTPPFNDYKHLKPTRVNSSDLSSKFDEKFRSYSKKGRVSPGDLISFKKSTEWLRDAGIVGQILTEEEADRAFKRAAGWKEEFSWWESEESLRRSICDPPLSHLQNSQRNVGKFPFTVFP
ncbi:uncharacterized protein CDAR_542461 [Caerostris darwini]|uniref:Uncharacterized protein n=1 Tax=Caerostris darwini TaxID=1538125 RepID=A0AAV4RRF3_9ARAC|nr:uncharacterized protein CDAR_542461 [Caerostris darwini]